MQTKINMAYNVELKVLAENLNGHIKNEISWVAIKLRSGPHRFDKLHKIFRRLSELVLTKSSFFGCVPFKHINFSCIFWSYRASHDVGANL